MDPTEGDLEARIRRLEDRAEITELVNRYALAVDDRDWAAIAQMYARDSVFDSVMGRFEGRDAVVAYYRDRTEQFGATFHVPHNVSLSFGGSGRADGIVAAHAELAIDHQTVMIALRYLDAYVHEEGSWRFLERQVQQLYAMPLADLHTGLAETRRKRWPGTDPSPAELPVLDRLPH